MIKSFLEMEQEVLSNDTSVRLALANAHDDHALDAVWEAIEKGIVSHAVLVGKEDEIKEILATLKADVSKFDIINEEDEKEAMTIVLKLIHEGKADVPMKGLMQTSTFMKGILDKEIGFKQPGQLLSQASLVEFKEQNRFLIISDCAVSIQPDVEQKTKIVESCVGLANDLGNEQPKIALVSAVEKVNPAIPNTVEADQIKQNLQDKYLIDGPLALDNAIDVEAAHHKGITGPVAGLADIMVVPDLWSGNMLTKGLVFFAHLNVAGVLNGLSRPVVMTSRTDTNENKYYSILTAVYRVMKQQ